MLRVVPWVQSKLFQKTFKMKSLKDLEKNFIKWKIVDYGYTSNLEANTFSQFQSWIEMKKHLPLNYLEGVRADKRRNLIQYWPECQSAMVFLFSYHQSHRFLQNFYHRDKNWNGLKLASYTLGFDGFDYHEQIKDILNLIGKHFMSEDLSLQYKLSLDIHPVLERDLAYRTGLGWFGKNSMFISKKHGSFTIIASLLFNKELPFESHAFDTDHCGQCTKCIEACPTEAIDPETRTIIANDCISTFTIETFKLDTIPSPKMNLKEGTVFGCDICQDVCPWNKRIDRIEKFEKNEISMQQKKIIDFFFYKDPKIIAADLELISERAFKKEFQNTSFERSGKRGILKNIKLYLKQLNVFS